MRKLMRRARAGRVWNFLSIPWTVSCINFNVSNKASIGACQWWGMLEKKPLEVCAVGTRFSKASQTPAGSSLFIRCSVPPPYLCVPACQLFFKQCCNGRVAFATEPFQMYDKTMRCRWTKVLKNIRIFLRRVLQRCILYPTVQFDRSPREPCFSHGVWFNLIMPSAGVYSYTIYSNHTFFFHVN